MPVHLWNQRAKRNTTGYRARVRCFAHEMDIAALRRFAEDGYPDADGDAVTAISDRRCPACNPRYMADAARAVHVTRTTDGGIVCSCCETKWFVEADDWVGVVGSELRKIG